MALDPETKAKHERDVHYGDPDAHELDEEQKEILREQSAPLEDIYSEEFQRYLNLLFKFFPKTPVHVRHGYGQGFLALKGKRKDGTKFERPCYPDMIAKMLDLNRWLCNHPKSKQPEYFWVAMREPRRSSLKAIDVDNKDGVLGYYQTREMSRMVSRPLPIVTVDHMQKIKRVYDAFPGHIWCVSSATLGLHVWEKLPGPQPLDLIEARNRSILKNIGLGKTEVHPMQGRALRRPFGQDYYSITNDGLLPDWQDQLNFFENVAATPTFESIFNALRDLVEKEWSRFLGTPERKARLSSPDPQISKFINRGQYSSIRDFVLADLDQWAANGFPLTDPVVQTDVPIDSSSAIIKKASSSPKNDQVKFNGQWVQRCRDWALNGLPEDNSIFLVVSNLAIWFYFVELHEIPENDRIIKILSLLVDFALNKHNGYITRLNLGQKQEVVDHIKSSVDSGIRNVGDHGEEVFARIRLKRQSGKYSKVYFLEQLILKPVSEAGSSNTLSSSVVLTVCCSVLDSPSKSDQSNPETWVPDLDDTPLPPALEKAIQHYYGRHGLKMNAPSRKKIVQFINYLRSRGGEGRLSIKALHKMGFTSYLSRQHIHNLDGWLIATEGYSKSAHISKLYRLSKWTLDKFSESTSDDPPGNAG